ncbi:hypothetical protein GKR54_06495 [Providencia alcalifaciens]|nr:hypothetical protein [Providencia alcalifaciens]
MFQNVKNRAKNNHSSYQLKNFYKKEGTFLKDKLNFFRTMSFIDEGKMHKQIRMVEYLKQIILSRNKNR